MLDNEKKDDMPRKKTEMIMLRWIQGVRLRDQVLVVGLHEMMIIILECGNRSADNNTPDAEETTEETMSCH